MLLLGVVVGDGPTPIDNWFLDLGRRLGAYRRLFLLFTDWWLMGPVLAGLIAVVLWRKQWWLAAAMTVCLPSAIAVVEVCKHIFGREKGDALSYPSGHSTFVVVVMGLLVVVTGAALWAVLAALSVSVLGMFGQAVTYHYFTDTVGGALLATGVVCLVALVAAADTVAAAEHRDTGRSSRIHLHLWPGR